MGKGTCNWKQVLGKEECARGKPLDTKVTQSRTLEKVFWPAFARPTFARTLARAAPTLCALGPAVTLARASPTLCAWGPAVGPAGRLAGRGTQRGMELELGLELELELALALDMVMVSVGIDGNITHKTYVTAKPSQHSLDLTPHHSLSNY
jgi:hypothetical protein